MYCSRVESVGEGLFYSAAAVGLAAATVWLIGLFRGTVVAIRYKRLERPMWVNYAALLTGLAVQVMILGLVLWGRLDWWMLLLFTPLLLGRFVLFWMGSSISRRTNGPGEGMPG